MKTTKRLGYLSAAPRVSTRLDAGASGPRAHVLGVMGAFEALGWQVQPFIVGDQMPPRAVRNFEQSFTASPWRIIVADLIRLNMGIVNSRRAWRMLGGQVDWVYERFAALQSLGWIFQRHGGIPWILETSGPFYYESYTERKSLILKALARRIEIAAYRRCDVLVCVTSTLKDLIVREAGISADKVMVVPNGADIHRFDPSRHPARRLFAGFTVGYVGALLDWQGLGLLLEATAELREEGLPIYIVIVGDGPARLQWETLCHSLKLGEQVHFVGQVAWNEVPSYIAGFDVGFSGQLPLQIGVMYHSPLKLYEYMAMGKPVVASAYEDAHMLIEGKNTGFLFQPGDVGDLTSALRQAYQARNMLSEMGQVARQEIIERHSWAARVGEMIPRAEKILERKY